MTLYDVVYGSLGCGKSTYALSIIDPAKSFKLGNNNHSKEVLMLQFGSIKRHEKENETRGLPFKRTTLISLIQNIESVNQPTLIIDEWTAFSSYSLLWSEDNIRGKINSIFKAIDRNQNLERVIFICSDYMPVLPFKLYKKRALWNKEVFKRADNVIKIEYGIPIKIK